MGETSAGDKFFKWIVDNLVHFRGSQVKYGGKAYTAHDFVRFAQEHTLVFMGELSYVFGSGDMKEVEKTFARGVQHLVGQAT